MISDMLAHDPSGSETPPSEKPPTGSPSSDLTGKSDDGLTSVAAAQFSIPKNTPFARIDLAQLAGGQFIVYGWILGFTHVERAWIDLGGMTIDLRKRAIPVRRPDVAQHFSLATGDEDHGFYALIDLPEKQLLADRLSLTVTLSSGLTAESFWPVTCSEGRAASALDPHAATLKKLLPNLPRQEAKRLVAFATPALGTQAEAEYLAALPPPLRFQVELCCILENRTLAIAGWLSDPLKEFTRCQVSVGQSVFDLLSDGVPVARPELDLEASGLSRRDAPSLPGFILIQSIPPHDRESPEARFVITAAAETAVLTRPVKHLPDEARRDFLAMASKLNPDAALAVTERIATVLGNLPEQPVLTGLLELIRDTTVDRLPPSLHHRYPRYALHLDQCILVADKGVFLLGWFNEEAPGVMQVVCHCGSSRFLISDHWIRHRRADVSSHLAKSGISVIEHDHGYTCYVPLFRANAPYYLSATSPSGEVNRMAVSVTDHRESPLQTVRAILSSFNWANCDLHSLLERHIGPAVGAAWAVRRRTSAMSLIRNYGTRPASPSVSVIVPLYGRHDFAEYQMALFADDPEFHTNELIYVVDDPTIVNEFLGRCSDLYGIYQVPFLFAYPGCNLGFAGANNFAADVARGRRLLLMNSDVLPKRRGWLGDLDRTYDSLPAPGLLGVKLLYEDGTIQHAGMAFRRLPAWSNLWTNHHPNKGLSPATLNGVRQVPAVTAACALIDAALYRELGGLSEDYIIGDFEDSDLCLRLISAGRQNHVALDIELYHLERQSQGRVGDAEWRTNITLYNCWLHNRRWSDLIEKVNVG